MKKFNYRLTQERIALVIVLIKLFREILELLSMAFNYLTDKIMDDGKYTKMDQQV